MPGKTLRESSATVEQFVQTTLDLIQAASQYAESGVYDAANDGMIRRLRVVSNALQSALQNVQVMPQMMMPTTVAAAAAPPVQTARPQAHR